MKKNLLLLTSLLITVHLLAQFDVVLWSDTITFEEPYEYLAIDSASQNIWQIGVPRKVFLDSAYSPVNVIITDTTDTYPVNNYSYFDVKLGRFNFGDYYYNDIFIEIKHKYDTDTLRDGCFLTISYDYGETWTNIIEDYWGYGVTPANNYYEDGNLYTEQDTLFNGELGFSGRSNGWVTTKFAWFYEACKHELVPPDTMLLRFNFLSDSIENNKEGWLIDNIVLYAININDIVEPYSLKNRIYPNPMTVKAYIETENYDEMEVAIFDVSGCLVRRNTFLNNEAITIDRGNLNAGLYYVRLQKGDGTMGLSKLFIK